MPTQYGRKQHSMYTVYGSGASLKTLVDVGKTGVDKSEVQGAVNIANQAIQFANTSKVAEKVGLNLKAKPVVYGSGHVRNKKVRPLSEIL